MPDNIEIYDIILRKKNITFSILKNLQIFILKFENWIFGYLMT